MGEEYLKTNSSPLKLLSQTTLPTLIGIWKPKSKRMNLSCDVPKTRTPIDFQTEMSLPLTVATWMLVEWWASPLCRGRCHTTLEQKMLWAAKTLRGTVVFLGEKEEHVHPLFFGRVGGEKGANGGYAPSKITCQWEIHPLKMYFLLKMGIFHCHVSFPEGVYPIPRN